MLKTIDSFSGDFDFLSNFYPSLVPYSGIMYLTVEHAYQAAKTSNIEERKRIENVATPALAKKLGRKVTLRPEWEDVKIQVMQKLVTRKFGKATLKKRLLDTGDAILVEGNWWGDRFWGVCKGKGENNLGIILMDVREQLQMAIES